MSSKSGKSGEKGPGELVDSHSKSSTPEPSSSEDSRDTMKRAAAKQMIERFYYQVTDGCGRSNCVNPDCASSSSFSHKSISRNQAAVKALDLFKKKANLCEPSAPPKVAREDVPGTSSSASSSTSISPTTPPSEKSPTPTSSTEPCTIPKAKVETPYLDEDKLHKIIEDCKTSGSYSHLIRTIGSVFNNSASMLLSFRKRKKIDTPSKEDLKSMEVDEDKDTDENPEKDQDSKEKHNDKPNNQPIKTCDVKTLKDYEITVDLESVQRAYNELFAIADHPFQSSLINAIITLSRNLEMEIKYERAYERDPNYLNIFLIVMELPTLHSPEFLEKATPLFCRATGALPLKAKAKFIRLFSKYPKDKLKSYVDCMQQMITVRVISNPWSRSSIVNDDEGIIGATKVLKLLYYSSVLAGEMDPQDQLNEEKEQNESAEENLQDLLQGAVGHEPKEKSTPKEDPLETQLAIHPIDCRKPLIAWQDFVNEPLCEQIEMDKDYTSYKSDKFSFMNHSFVLTTGVKHLGMYYDNRIRMINERRASVLQSLVHGAPTTPYLRLRIRRDHIIDDALVSLEMAAMDNPQDLKKQLYVEFEGEQGIDEGGVSKEFFQLVVEEIFNPDIGMFTYNEETRKFWFNSTSFENDGQFSLIGIVLGLAIYNNIILDIHFPMVVYRRLMGKKGTFDDLKDSHPTLARGLMNLLDYDGDVSETFMQTFRISYTDVFGTTLTHDLKTNGDDITVTNENKQEYVDLYADYLLNKSIEKQFRAFKRGFQMVTDESPIKMLFRPDEVEMLVCGEMKKALDFNALEQATDYDGGFTQDSSTVKHFWEVVHGFSEEQKKLLLQFTTGSDRVPIGGLCKLKLIIARNGPDSERLPTAHTCFNVLLLPDYLSKDKLEERLLKAITHAKGFGML